MPGLTVRYGRRSIGLAQTLRAVAPALGGRAGARLSRRLAAAVSRMTLLRIIRAMPNLAPGGPVWVLGVDDFALRRGHVYGTVLIRNDVADTGLGEPRMASQAWHRGRCHPPQ